MLPCAVPEQACVVQREHAGDRPGEPDARRRLGQPAADARRGQGVDTIMIIAIVKNCTGNFAESASVKNCTSNYAESASAVLQ